MLSSRRMLILASFWLASSFLLVHGNEQAMATDAAPLRKSWTLFHKTGDQLFQPRGHVVMEVSENGGLELKIDNDSNDGLLTPADIDAPWYQLKLVPDDKSSAPVVTTVPACLVRRANFRYVVCVCVRERVAEM